MVFLLQRNNPMYGPCHGDVNSLDSCLQGSSLDQGRGLRVSKVSTKRGTDQTLGIILNFLFIM